jgi:hypothetical protein
MQRLEQARQASAKLSDDEALANYKLDCFEAPLVQKTEPTRARQLAERATQALPKLNLGWWTLLACIRDSDTNTDAETAAVLERAFAATGNVMFRSKTYPVHSTAAAPVSFETLVYSSATASDLLRAAIAHLRQNFEPGLAVEPRAWFACWAQLLPHRDECDALSLAAFDAGTLAYALGAFSTSDCAWLLGQMCGASARSAPTSQALWVLFAPESELPEGRALQVCALSVGDFTPPPELPAKSHPLSVLVSAMVRFGMLLEAQRLLSQNAARVEMSILRAAKRVFDTQVPEHAGDSWNLLHDALHPAACLRALLAGELDSGDSDPELENLERRSELDEDSTFEALTHAELVDDFLDDVGVSAKLLRLDPEKFRALPPGKQIALIDAFDEINPADADAVQRTRRLANDFGVARATEVPKLNLPKGTQDKNRRKRERRDRKGKK